MMVSKMKISIYIGCLCISIILLSCTNNNFFSDAKINDVNIPIVSLGGETILDLDNIPKYDSHSLLPAPLKNGSEHQIISDIQSRLMALGFMEEDKTTSFYGDSTEDAIKKLQRQLSIKQNGICDQYVYDALMSNDAPTYEVKRSYEGEDVKILQQQLYELSYLLYENDVNGYFGKKTEIAVREMQKSNNLKETGIIDLITFNFLYNENVKAYTITNKSDPEVIKIYQIRLRDLGYYFGPCEGVYSEDFKTAVRTYQQNNSQQPDGYIGPSTKFSLDSKYARPFTMFLDARGQNVKLMQERLVSLNYLEARRASGFYGDYTAQAVALFQEKNNLPVTGVVDGLTNMILNTETAIPSEEGPRTFISQQIRDIIAKHKEEQTVEENIGNVEDLLKVASLKLGSKYIWGRRGPNVFDCSGFVFWCLNQVGANVAYMTTYNWRFCTQFERVETFEDLIPGDLLIINGHMGIVAEMHLHQMVKLFIETLMNGGEKDL